MKISAMAAGSALLMSAAAQEVALHHGRWETTMRFARIEAPGLPEEAMAPIRRDLGRTNSQSSCMTPAEAADPISSMADAGGEGCDFSQSTFGGGEFALRGTCPGPEGPGTMRLAIDGTYTATTMEASITTETDIEGVQGATGPIRMYGTFSSRRVGACGS